MTAPRDQRNRPTTDISRGHFPPQNVQRPTRRRHSSATHTSTHPEGPVTERPQNLPTSVVEKPGSRQERHRRRGRARDEGRFYSGGVTKRPRQREGRRDTVSDSRPLALDTHHGDVREDPGSPGQVSGPWHTVPSSAPAVTDTSPRTLEWGPLQPRRDSSIPRTHPEDTGVMRVGEDSVAVSEGQK